MTADALRTLPIGRAALRGARSRLVWVAVAAPVGVFLIAVANSLAFRGSPQAVPLFWAGLVVIVGTGAAALWSEDLSRREAIGILLIVGLALYSLKILHSPAGIGGTDDLLHYRTLDDLARTGRLFADNPLLLVSPYYPGLELVTATLMKVSGAGLFMSAMIVVGFTRVLMVLSLFLFLERIAAPRRLAALGTLLYMACPSYLFFDAQFAYESLAIPLATFCLFAFRAGQLNEGGKRTLFNLSGMAAGLAVVVTHHVTSFILVGTLFLWMLVTLALRRWNREPLPGGGWGPFVIFGAVLIWLVTVARAVVDYLGPAITSTVTELMEIIGGESTVRRLFESNAGMKSPLLERAVGLGSQALILACIPFGLLYLWRHQRKEPVAWVCALAAVIFPAMMLLHFTRHGWDIGSRAQAFVYIPLVLVLVSGLELLRRRYGRVWARAAVVAPLVVIIFAGGVIAGSSPRTRLPGPYRPGSGETSIDAETIAAALWTRDVLGPGQSHRR